MLGEPPSTAGRRPAVPISTASMRLSRTRVARVTFGRLAAQEPITFMKCEELLAMLNDYVDGTVDPAICEEFEKHMAGCNPCQVVVDNIRQTITLYKEGKPYELPLRFRERLHAALRERWKETHGTKGEAQ